MADDPQRPDPATAPEQQEDSPEVASGDTETTAEEPGLWDGAHFHKGQPLKNRYWQTLAHRVQSFAKPVGFDGEYMKALAGHYYNAFGFNVYMDWVFLISDTPIETDQLEPSQTKSEAVRLGNGEFVTDVRQDRLGKQLWVYVYALTEKWGPNADIQQFVIDTGDRPPRRFEDVIFVGPVLNSQRLVSRCVHPSECDPDLLDPDERKSPAGRLLVMSMKDGPTEAQADQVIETLVGYDDLHKRDEYLWLAILATICYDDIRKVLQPKLEAVMSELKEVSFLPPWQVDEPIATPEEYERFEIVTKALFSEDFLQNLSVVREAKAEAKAEAEAEMKEAIVAERVSTLVSHMAKCDAEIRPEEVAELKARSVDQLPSVDAIHDITTRDDFLELAKLNGHGHPRGNGADSDE